MSAVGTDVEKTLSRHSLTAHRSSVQHPPHVETQSQNRVSRALRSFEETLLKWNVELRGIRRVEDDEKQRITWFAYVQVFVLWTSVNLAINNVTLGM